MKCKNYEAIVLDEEIAVRKLRNEAISRKNHAFFVIQVLVEGKDGNIEQRIASVNEISRSMMKKLGFSTAVRKHIFDGTSWSCQHVYTSYNKRISNNLLIMSDEAFYKMLEGKSLDMKTCMRDARKNAKRLLTV